MKKVLTSVIAIGCLAAAGSAYAAMGAGTGVNGSLHDMTIYGASNIDKMGRVCVYCHAPHHAMTNNAATSPNNVYPLWNHQVSTATFTPYAWATPDNNWGVGSIGDPLIGPSRLCMSCHDGSVAVDEHGNWSNNGAPNNGTWGQSGRLFLNGFDNNRANLTSNLTNTHPIGFDYNQVAGYRNGKSANGTGTKDATTGKFTDGTEIVVSSKQYASAIRTNVTDGTYNVVTRDLGGKTIADNLYNGNIMTCATCHEVHNKENVVQDPYVDGSTDVYNRTLPNYFLYAKETNSLICLSCHVK